MNQTRKIMLNISSIENMRNQMASKNQLLLAPIFGRLSTSAYAHKPE